jgi:hypothetical protein
MAETVTVSANTDAGFSTVVYTGDGAVATVGHGLSKTPEMIIVKNITPGVYPDARDDWRVYHSGNTSAPETDYLELNDIAATADDAGVWNDTAPTADVFTIGDSVNVNTDDETYIAFCFHSVDGYSKVGSYVGNGSADGTFIYLGFRPAFILHKVYNTTGQWLIWDTARDTYNVINNGELSANDSGVEGAGSWGNQIDIVSNGFKFRGSDNTNFNHTGFTYIYYAVAEQPFKHTNAK